MTKFINRFNKQIEIQVYDYNNFNITPPYSCICTDTNQLINIKLLDAHLQSRKHAISGVLKTNSNIINSTVYMSIMRPYNNIPTNNTIINSKIYKMIHPMYDIIENILKTKLIRSSPISYLIFHRANCGIMLNVKNVIDMNESLKLS